MKFREFHPNIKIRLGETFVSRLVGSMIFPFMTLYLAYHFGAKLTGILLIINVFIGIACSFVGGYLADHYGRRNIMIVSECVRAVAFLIMALSNSPWFESPVLTFLMMTVNTICFGFGTPATQAMLIDVSTQNERKLMYTISYWASNFANAVGGILGAFLFNRIPKEVSLF
ncbi:major facilitator superfamily protein, partial [Fictibacillus macauensis ZFHKF-1]